MLSSRRYYENKKRTETTESYKLRFQLPQTQLSIDLFIEPFRKVGNMVLCIFLSLFSNDHFHCIFLLSRQSFSVSFSCFRWWTEIQNILRLLVRRRFCLNRKWFGGKILWIILLSYWPLRKLLSVGLSFEFSCWLILAMCGFNVCSLSTLTLRSFPYLVNV